MEEIWKDIEGYEGLYQVSSQGQIKSLDYNNKKIEKTLKPATRKDLYQHVTLTKDGKQKQYYIHFLVATAFLDNPGNLPVINHKDCNPSNNCVDNLEWCSYSYNNSYDGAIKKRMEAARNNNSTCGPKYCDVYLKTGEFIKRCKSIKEASDFTKCDYRDVWKICNKSGRAKSIHGFTFKI